METAFYDVVRSELGPAAFKDMDVLHVGCYRFEESSAIAALGANVTGLDKCKRLEPPSAVKFIEADFLTWKPDRKYDILYSSNAALFMPTEAQMQKIEEIAPRVITIRTMYNFPEPNWPAEKLQKLYFTRAKDWTDRFEAVGYRTVLAKDYEDLTPDLHGDSRTFRFTEYIGVKE